MGLLVDGKWLDQWYATKENKGRFVRSEAAFRNWITMDGSASASGVAGFKAEADRYHLYVSLACPWAHRTMIFRHLKGLQSIISYSVVNANMGAQGWTFEPGPGVVSDPVNHVTRLHEIYSIANADYSGRVTVPVLWDKKQNTMVSNESSEIIRMFNSAFDQVGATGFDYYPHALRKQIEKLNQRIYHTVNNGVYRAGFATTQEAYEEAVTELFETLDFLDQRLHQQRYLAGSQITEADWRLFTTLVRFEPVYFGHFKCNQRRIRDYKNLWPYVCDLYQQPGIAETVDIEYIKQHYYGSHLAVNPTGIVPTGPNIDYNESHGRNRFQA